MLTPVKWFGAVVIAAAVCVAAGCRSNATVGDSVLGGIARDALESFATEQAWRERDPADPPIFSDDASLRR